MNKEQKEFLEKLGLKYHVNEDGEYFHFRNKHDSELTIKVKQAGFFAMWMFDEINQRYVCHEEVLEFHELLSLLKKILRYYIQNTKEIQRSVTL